MTEPRINPVTQQWQPRNELEAFGLRFVQVFNDHQLEAGLAMCGPEIRAMPSRATGTVDGYRGLDGVREWFRTVSEQPSWFEILVSSMQQVEPRSTRSTRGGFFDLTDLQAGRGPEPMAFTTLTMFGDVCLEGEALSPWASVIVVVDGLIVRHRSYLSTRDLMDEIGVIPDAAHTPGAEG